MNADEKNCFKNKSDFEKKLIEKNEAVPFYSNFPMTRFKNKDEKGNIEPVVSDEDVKISKNFVEENHK